MMAIAASELREVGRRRRGAMLQLIQRSASGGDLAGMPLIEVLDSRARSGLPLGRNRAFVPVLGVVRQQRIEFKSHPWMARGDQVVIHVEHTSTRPFRTEVAQAA
jgi:hypothetical protein